MRKNLILRNALLVSGALAAVLCASPASIAREARCGTQVESASASVDGHSLTFTFETSARTGQIMVALFDSEAAFNADQAMHHAVVDVSRGQTSVTFDHLPAGRYGMKAFHDVNANGQLDRNPFGIPAEPFAFSNNARGNMGPARWDRAGFVLEGDTVQSIDLR